MVNIVSYTGPEMPVLTTGQILALIGILVAERPAAVQLLLTPFFTVVATEPSGMIDQLLILLKEKRQSLRQKVVKLITDLFETTEDQFLPLAGALAGGISAGIGKVASLVNNPSKRKEARLQTLQTLINYKQQQQPQQASSKKPFPILYIIAALLFGGIIFFYLKKQDYV